MDFRPVLSGCPVVRGRPVPPPPQRHTWPRSLTRPEQGHWGARGVATGDDLRAATGKPGLLAGPNRFLSITFKSSLYGIKKKYKVPINRLETTFL